MFSERLGRLRPYVPGEQPQDRKYIKLNTNENPYPPSPLVSECIRQFEVERLRLYPDPLFARLRERIAAKYGVGKEMVFVCNGSDEGLSFAFCAFFDGKRGPLLFPEFTYSFYPVYCDFYGIEHKRTPLKEDFSVDLDAFLQEDPSCGIIFANPNAPTGIGLPLREISRFIEHCPKDRVVLIDEAYVDFGGESALPLIREYENLLIMRTFSKSMSLAGQRLGFTLGSSMLTNALFTVKDSFNSYTIDALSLAIGEAALSSEGYYRSTTEKIISTRERLSSALAELGWQVLPSKANFVFAGKRGISGKDIYLALKQRDILVRYFDVEGIRDFVRITVGTQDQMDQLLAELSTLPLTR